MTEHSPPPPQASDIGPQRGARRATGIMRRERALKLMALGCPSGQIAKMVRTSVATVRRKIDRALAERQLGTAERFVRAPVARLMKALRLVEAAVEFGELTAAAVYLRIAAALDRYHEAARSPPPIRSTKAPPRALPDPPQALTFIDPTDNDDSAVVEEAQHAAQAPEMGGEPKLLKSATHESGETKIGVSP